MLKTREAMQAQVPLAALARQLPRSTVAVVDISYIFKNHKDFKMKMDGMKKEVQEFEATLRGTTRSTFERSDAVAKL